MKPYVITLSSIPPRFDRLALTFEALRHQTVPPEAIILYVPSLPPVPDWEGTLPQVPEGVEIRRVETDYGPRPNFCLRYETLPNGMLKSCFAMMTWTIRAIGPHSSCASAKPTLRHVLRFVVV